MPFRSDLYVHRSLSFSLFPTPKENCALFFVYVHRLIELSALKYVAGSGMGAAAVFERGDVVDQLSNARIQSNKLLSKDAK